MNDANASTDAMVTYSPEQLRLVKLFYPHVWGRYEQLGINGRLVHYSSADAAMAILQNTEIWMRNTTVMNDFTEVEHGLNALADAFKSPAGLAFQEFLNLNFDGVCQEVANVFDTWQDIFRDETYIMCVSEHSDSEDQLGRLSMWRAYGGASGVALVMKSAPFRSETNLLQAYSSPVRYANRAGLQADFLQLKASFEAEVEFLKTLGRDAVQGHLFNMFKWSALSIKHPGFAEELEWRVAYTPSLAKSGVIRPAVRSIRGIPQIVQRLPLQKFEGSTFSTAIADILDSIIIGPTEYPLALRAAFEELLSAAGVENARAKVFVSDIPLR